MTVTAHAHVEVTGAGAARTIIISARPGERVRSFHGATMRQTLRGNPVSQTTIQDMTTNPATTQPGPIGFAKMAGSSIAGRDAAPWVTDFLNAAYYRRDAAEREVDDLRFAFFVLTTYWYRKDPTRRLRVTDLPAFHRAFGSERFAANGRLTREALERGASTLIGDWFAANYKDPALKGWGVVFETADDKAAYNHDHRMKLAKVGELTAESAPLDQQVWHTYDPVEVPSAEGLIEAILQPETWPNYASAIGRFTPLKPGGLLDQTFEIEVAAGTDKPVPVWTRGYVTITSLVTPDDPKALHDWFEALEDGMEKYGDGRIVPEGAEPIVGFDLTTHRGHFMGSGHNRLVLYAHEGKTWVKAAGTWDPMPWHLDKAYHIAGEEAQHAFWGARDDEALSMLHQLANQISA